MKISIRFGIRYPEYICHQTA